MSKSIYEAPQWKIEPKIERPTVTVGPEYDALTQAVANGWINKEEEPLVIQQLRESGFLFGKRGDVDVIMPDDISPI